jgi:S-DNA-T family DNA segregation ATPase FtsK/SpoIIIE
MFNYGSFKIFLSKISIGLILICISSFFIISIITHNPNDPGIGKLSTGEEIFNFFGLWGAISSSIFLVFFGRLSLIFIFFLLYSGFLLSIGFKFNKYFLKLFLVVISSVIINFCLVINKLEFLETGLIAKILLNIFSYYLPTILTNTLYKFILSFLFFIISATLLISTFSIKLRIINKIFLKIFSSIFGVFLKTIIIIKMPFRKNFNAKTTNSKSRSEPTILKKVKVFKSRDKHNKTKTSVKIPKNEFVFNLPTIDLLIKSKTKNSHRKEVENLNKINSSKLEKVLAEYGVVGKVIGFKTGPIVTLYEFIPNAGIKASKVIGLSDDIARAMSSVSARISSQPGKTSLGIEIPNLKRESVVFSDLLEGPKFEAENNSLTLALGKDISGQLVYADLEKMPHLLIAGTTGSGKSVGINTIIMSILYRFKPDECKLILIDPKMLELSIYEDIPHLLTPVVTNPNKAVFALKWVVKEMENRYKLMSLINVKNINSYNEKSKKILLTGKKLYKNVQTGIDDKTRQPVFEKREIPLEKMPFIVVVIDEMADLMMVAGKEVENLVQRLAQMARASGIHLVTATQRPSVDVITGTIKANFPSRLSYKVASKFDSRTILNEMGAEQLLGSGDMLFLENGANLKRLHGGFLSEDEIEKVVKSIKEQAVFDQKNEITLEEKNEDGSMAFGFDDGEVDALYAKAVDIVISQQKVSTSYIQRYLQIGYNRAARIVEKMEEEGLITEANNAGKRQVLRKN